MKSTVSVLRTTTAIMVSLSLAGTHALAAASGGSEIKLAQADGQAAADVQAGGLTLDTGALVEDRIDAALTAIGGGDLDQAEQAVQSASELVDELRPAVDPGQPQFHLVVGLDTAREALAAADADAARMALMNARTALGAIGFGQEQLQPAAEVETAEQPAVLAQTADVPPVEEPVVEAEAEPAAEEAAEVEADAASPAPEVAEGVIETPDEGVALQEDAEEPTAAEAEPAEAAEVEADATSPAPEIAEGEVVTPGAEAEITDQPVATEAEATVEQPAATEAQATEAQATEAEATDQQTTIEQEAVETVEQVTEEEIQEVTSTGQDVVVEAETSAADLEAQLDELRQRQVDLETQLSETVEIQEEVVTEATSRSADEEVVVRDDDDNQVWKYLGAAAAGAAVGALVPALGGRLVQDQGDRVIVERGGEFFVRSDENQLLRQPGATVQTEEFPSGISRTTVTREDGSRVVTIRNDGGFILRRTRITPDGQEIVLLEQTPEEVYSFGEWEQTLPQAITHRAQTVDYSRADQEELREALYAQPTYDFERSFPLQAVREVEQVRGLVPAVDLPINFRSGSAAIQRSEIEELTQLGRMMADSIDENPREIFLVEGHTDAVGSNLMNLALSDRRAEAVALALTEYFDVPPENLVVQGYGERYLKEQTEGSSAVNRRATVRRITPLIDQVASR